MAAALGSSWPGLLFLGTRSGRCRELGRQVHTEAHNECKAGPHLLSSYCVLFSAMRSARKGLETFESQDCDGRTLRVDEYL